MKAAKKDIKYIIKRIIIGVAIALILANINKCNVYADSTEVCISQSGWYITGLTTNNCSSSDYYFNYGDFNVNLRTNYNVENRTNFFAFNFYNSDLDSYLIFQTDVDNSLLNNIRYLGIKSDSDSRFPNEYYNHNVNTLEGVYSLFPFDDVSWEYEDNRTYDIWRGDNYYILFSTHEQVINHYRNIIPYTWSGEFFSNIEINGTTYYVYAFRQDFVDGDYFFNNYEYIGFQTNMVLPTLPNPVDFENFYYINNENELVSEELSESLPSGYSEINLQNKQGVYFVPKNYSTIPTELVSSIKFIKFPFYYKGNIKTAYFDLKNNNKIVFDFTQTYSSFEFEFINTSFPMYYEENGTFSEDPNGYIIYNNVISDSSIVRYNSELFNAFIIEDMNNYSDNITFINENGESESLSISFNKSLQEIWEDGISNGGEHFSDFASKSNLYKFFDIIKFPFTYIKSLNNTTCIPLSFDLPFINYTLSVPCLSSIFQNYFGRYYDLIRILISGIVLYNVFLVNFYTVIEVLKPQSSQVEVVDL